MPSINPQPSSPEQWQQYAQSDAIASIPFTVAQEGNSAVATYRGVYLDESTVLNASSTKVHIYTDVFAFTSSEITFSPPSAGTIHIVARVLTAPAPVNLKINRQGTRCTIALYASVIDQPISVLSEGFGTKTLQLGPTSGNLGAVVTVTDKEIQVSYQPTYFIDSHAAFEACLETQLRIALALFWQSTSIAISLCAHVTTMTSQSPKFPLVNAQAVALGQQLAAQTITGPDMSYLPTLQADSYMDAVEKALDAMLSFQEQYDRFQDKDQAWQTLVEQWDAMLDQAVDQRSMLVVLRDAAYSKYTYACDTVFSCSQQFEADNGELIQAQAAFEAGLAEWQYQQRLKAVFNILETILKVAVNIGELCLLGIGGAGGAEKAVEEGVDAVEKAEEIADQVSKELSLATLKKLLDCVKILQTIYPNITTIVTAVKALESNPSTDIPTTGDISGSNQGDADANLIVTLAAWDEWVLESDNQMQVAVDNNIGGAAGYRLALRKHAINGKQLAQVQTEAIKAGQQYVQAEMNVLNSDKDVERLQQLKDGFKGQDEVYQEAAARFYDRVMAMRTSVVIQLRNLTWAYRYYALAESSVQLDATKTVAEYKQDIYIIGSEIQAADEQYGSDFQYFENPTSSSELPSNYGPLMIDGLQGSTHSSRFILLPKTSTTKDSFASVFTDGTHYRLEGLEAELKGAMPNKDALENGVVIVVLEITTSGIYQDIRDDQVFNFTSLPQIKRYSYELTESGKKGKVHDKAIFPAIYHTEPTPFTQWTIKLLYPDRLDLTGLTEVKLDWAGHVRYLASEGLKESN